MKRRFQQFINFGPIANKRIRSRIVDSMYENLYEGRITQCGLRNDETENFAFAVDKIIADDNLRKYCKDDLVMTEQVMQESFNFIFNTVKLINRTEKPYGDEYELLQDFKTINKNNFEPKWKPFADFIEDTYNHSINTSFFYEEFIKSLKTIKKKSRSKKTLSYAGIREHFCYRWQNIIDNKLNKWEINFIEDTLERYLEDLYKLIENLNNIEDTIKPPSDEMGRLWSNAIGKWHTVNFDILEEYLEYFERDINLQNLIKILGKSQKSEVVNNENMAATSGTVVYSLDQAGKEELTGVCEGGDLSAILPQEIVMLTDNSLDTIFYKKLREKTLQNYEYTSNDILNDINTDKSNSTQKHIEMPGPFIICIDSSASMRGESEKTAKTISFALLKTALSQKRQCYLISFSTEIETLNLTDLSLLDRLVDFLKMSFNGGSNAEPAFTAALNLLETTDFKKADVIMVSDFILPCFKPDIIEAINNAKKNKTKFYGILIGEINDLLINHNVIEYFDSTLVYGTSKKMTFSDSQI